MEHLAGHTRADGPPVAHENYEHAYNEAYAEAFETQEHIVINCAKAYLSGANTKVWGDICHSVDLGCEDCALTVFAHVLLGANSPARESLIETLCHDAAVREAELQADGD